MKLFISTYLLSLADPDLLLSCKKSTDKFLKAFQVKMPSENASMEQKQTAVSESVNEKPVVEKPEALEMASNHSAAQVDKVIVNPI